MRTASRRTCSAAGNTGAMPSMTGFAFSAARGPNAARVDPTNCPSLAESTRLIAYITVKNANSSVMKSA